MSCKDKAIGPSESSTYTPPSQSACHKLEESAISRQKSTTAVSHEKSWKPPVAPKPSLLSIGKSCRTAMLPTTITLDPENQIQSPNNEASQKNQQDSHSGLPCRPQMQLVMHSSRVPVLPVPHPSVQSSPPEVPPRPGRTSYPNSHHKTYSIAENEKQPPLPPKPRRLSDHSHSENLKVLPVESEHSLTLKELADNHSKSFPVQVKIVQGFYGKTNRETFYNNETFNIVCPKHEEVLVIRDDNQHHYSVPLSSAIQFSLLYAPDGMKYEEAMRGQTFKKVANIVELETTPKVICATKSCSGVNRNEVLVILGVHKPRMKGKKGLKVFSLLTHSKKTLPHDCTGDFSTESSLIRMYPADIHASLHYLKQSIFPCDAKLHFNSEVVDQLQSLPMPGHLTGVITVCELNTRRSLVAYQVFSEDYDGKDPPIFDIPLDEKLSDIEIIVADDDLKNEFWEVQLTSSTVSVLKSVSSNPSKLQPWEPEQSDTTKTLLRKTVRRGYENVGIRLEVNPQLAHSANMHELMEADAAADMRDGYDTITFDNVPSDIQASDASESDTDSPSHESTGYDSDRPQCPPRTSRWSRPSSFVQKATPRQLPVPVQNESPTESYEDVFSPLSKDKPPPVPLQTHSPVGGYTIPQPITPRVEDEYTTCTSYPEQSGCQSPKSFSGQHETVQDKSHPPNQELSINPPLQQMQEQIQSLQKQMLSLMRKKDDFSRTLTATEKVQERIDPIADIKLQDSDLKHIMQTLCDLSTWYLLGVYLDVPKGKLDQFHATYNGGPDAVERCKIETICYWLENARKPTWATLAAAVLAMGRRGIVEKISNRCGVRLPIHEEREQYETILEVLPKQVPKVKILQKEMELKDQEFSQVEQKQGQLEEQLRNLQSELNTVRDLLQFNERLTRKLITDGQRIESDLTRSTSLESSQVTNHSLAMHRKRDRISSLQKEQQYSSSKLKEAQKEQRELLEKLHYLESKIVMTSQELRLLQTQRQSARAALQQQELAINETLVSRTEHQYYNIVIQDGKVEMKLTQQQVETLRRKVWDENVKVKQLHEQLQFHQQKLQEVTRQKEQLDRKSQAAAQLEKHQRAYLESTLEADVMQCQIEIYTTEFHKQQMENHIYMLRSKMTNLKRRQHQYEQIVIQQKSSSQSGKSTDLPYRPRFYSVSQNYREPHCYYEEVDSPSSTESHAHHFHRNHSTRSAKAKPVLRYRAMPVSTNWEQHPPFNPTTTQFIPAPHVPLFRSISLHGSHHKPHPPPQCFPSAIPNFSNPPYMATSISEEDEYAGLQPDEGYVIERFDEMGEVEKGTNDDSMLNSATYEPIENYGSHEYNFSQKAEYLPFNNYDSDEFEECYSETHFTPPSDHDLAHQLPSYPPKSSKNGYM